MPSIASPDVAKGNLKGYNKILHQNLVQKKSESRSPETDYPYTKNRLIFKRIWNDFKKYKSQSVSNRSYNPRVQKHVIPEKDFTDIHINNFIIHFVNKYGKNHPSKLDELAQYLIHCFMHYKHGDNLNDAFQSFPKAKRTWFVIQQKDKNIRIKNMPSAGSDVKRISSNKLSNGYLKVVTYVAVEWYNSSSLLCNQISSGLFSNSQIENYQMIQKLNEFVTSQKLEKKFNAIADCFRDIEITQEYFVQHSRKEFVELLKSNCNVKVSLAIKLWNHLTN